MESWIFGEAAGARALGATHVWLAVLNNGVASPVCEQSRRKSFLWVRAGRLLLNVLGGFIWRLPRALRSV